MQHIICDYQKLISSINTAAVEDIARSILIADRIVIAGNGGSYGNATHIAGDLSANTKIKALTKAVGDNLVSFSALSNDVSYKEAMALDVERWLMPGTLVILLSTSGHSKNIIALAQTAYELGAKVVTITGQKPSPALTYQSSIHMALPHTDAGLLESAFDFIGHLLVKEVNLLLKLM